MSMFGILGIALLAAWGPQDTGAHWITGGMPAQAGAWPSIVSIQAEEVHKCTGVLVAPTVVLTAGHCDAPELDTVFVGGTDLWDFTTGEVIPIASRVRYPESWASYDLTLVELTEPATALPSPIARACALPHLKDGATVELVGFGATDVWGTIATHVLMEARTTITDADCSREDAGCHIRVQPGGEFIAGGNGVDTCTGDSGGPAFLWTPWGEPVLAGLTSRAASPSETPCGDGGIYVRADAVADWVETTSGIQLTDPDCDADPIIARDPSASPRPWSDTSIDTGALPERPSGPAGGCGCASQPAGPPLRWIAFSVALIACVRFRAFPT